MIVALDQGEEDEMFVKSMQKLSYRLQNELKVPASRITERVLKIFPSHSSIVLLSTVVAKCVNYLIFVGPWDALVDSKLIVSDVALIRKTVKQLRISFRQLFSCNLLRCGNAT